MFNRSKFVTNSSSTSFICFGVYFDDTSAEGVIKHTVPPEELSRELWIRSGETIEEWARTIQKTEQDISVHYDWENEDGVVYIRDSYYSLDDGGFKTLPLDRIIRQNVRRGEWTAKLEGFCEKWGVESDKAEWKVACEVNW